MDKLDKLRSAALAGKHIADYDHAALARYVTALNPVLVLELLDVAEQAERVLRQCDLRCGSTADPCGHLNTLRTMVDKLVG